MANLGKLYYEFKLEDRVTSELTKIEKEFDKLSRLIDRNKILTEDLGKKPIKVRFDTSGVKEVEKVIMSVEAKMESLKTKVNGVMVVTPKNQAEFAKLKAQADALYNTLEKLSKIPPVSTIGYGGTADFGAEGRRIAANKRREMEIRDVIAQLERQEAAEKKAAETAKRAAKEAEQAKRRDAAETLRATRNTENLALQYQRLTLLVEKYKMLELLSPKASSQSGLSSSISALEMLKNSLRSIDPKDSERVANVMSRVRMETMNAADARRRYTEVAKQQEAADRLAANAAQGVSRAFDKLNTASTKQSRIMQQLNAQMGMYFSIYTVERFLGSIIKIGGEFEKQRVAIKSILGSGTKANEIYSQMKSLAVESPFTFQNLISYAKQLTAFSIPYNELYDTTKRLADISAGLGVDMSRIILAYGQVRSASFLRGQEVRQFTEAGIPLLDRLAKKFTELEGRAVSAGDVFEKISKRQVPFQMVKDVLWDMTDAGGQFYNMQAVLTETLPGKWEKLKDTWQIMLSDLAEGTSITGKLFKTSLDGITALTRSISSLMPLFGGFLAGFLGQGAIKGARSKLGYNVSGMVQEAQRLNIIEIERRHILGQINAEERATLISNTQNLQLVYRQLIMEGKIDAVKMRRLYTQGQINAELVREMAQLNVINAQEEKLILGQGKLNALRAVGSKMWSSWIVPNAWMIGISLAVAGISALVSKYREAGIAAQKSVDAAQESFGRLANVSESLGEDAKSEAGLKTQIDAVKDALKEVDPYYDRTLEAVKNTVELSEQYKKLKERLDELQNAYEGFAGDEDFFKDLLKTRTGFGFLNQMDDVLGEIAQKASQVREAVTGMDKVETSHLKNALKELADSSKEARDAIYGEDGRMLSVKDAIFNLFGADNANRKQFYKTLATSIFNSGDHKLGVKISAIFDDLSRTFMPQIAEKWTDKLKLQFEKEGSNLDFTTWASIVLDNAVKSLKDYNDPYVQKQFGVAFKEAIGGDFIMKGAIIDNKETVDTDNDGGGGNKKDTYLEQMKHRYELLKKYHAELEKYKKVMSETQATELLRSNGNFPEISQWFTDANDMERSINELVDKMNGSTEERKEFIRSLREGLEQDSRDKLLKDIDATNKALKSQLDIIQEQYETYKKWVKLTGDEQMASNMAFGGSIENKSYSEYLKSGLQKYLSDTGSKYSAEEILGMTNAEFKEKIGENSEVISQYYNEWQENDKKVRKETADTLYDIISKSRTYEDTLSDINAQYDERIRIIRESNNLNEQQKQNAVDAANKERNEKLSEEMFKHFQETSNWVKVFDDLGRVSSMTIDDMVDKIDEFSRTSGLSIATVKRLRDALDKLHKEQMRRNPIQAITSGYGQAAAIRNLLGGWQGNVLRTGGMVHLDKAQAAKYGMSAGSYNLDDFLNRLAEATDDGVKGLDALAKGFKDVQGALQPVIDLFDSLGETTLSDLFKTGSNALGAAASVGGSFKSLSDLFGDGSSGLSKALGAAGPYGAAAAAALSVATSIIDLHDKSIQKEIDASKQRQKEMQNLTNNIKNVLEYTLGGIYSYKAESSDLDSLKDYLKQKTIRDLLKSGESVTFSDFSLIGLKNWVGEDTKKAIRKAISSNTAFDVEYASLLTQRDELMRQQDLERQKKKKDKNVISDYDQEIKEITQKIRTFAQDFAKEIYDIDLKGWAEDFGDALYDAWKNGESGMDAYKKTASKILGELTNKVLTMRYIEPALERVGDLIFGKGENSFGFFSDGVITEDEVAMLGNAFSDIAENVDLYNKLMDQVNGSVKSLGFDLKDSESSSSSGLSKGIQGMSEETSELLASYSNAIRADVSYIRLILERVYGSTDNVIALSQIEQLRIIAANTAANAASAAEIKSLLDRVVRGDSKFNVK